MPTINKINDPDPSFTALPPKASKPAGKNVFENTLDKALDKTPAAAMESMPPSALREIAEKELRILNSSDIVSKKTHTLLEQLDSYSSKLENPAISLKRLAQVLEGIKTSAESLKTATGNLSKSDDGLKKIADQTLVTAHTEYLKFQRGDYLS